MKKPDLFTIHMIIQQILIYYNVFIGVEQWYIGPVIYLQDLDTGEKLYWHEGIVH